MNQVRNDRNAGNVGNAEIKPRCDVSNINIDELKCNKDNEKKFTRLNKKRCILDESDKDKFKKYMDKRTQQKNQVAELIATFLAPPLAPEPVVDPPSASDVDPAASPAEAEAAVSVVDPADEAEAEAAPSHGYKKILLI